MLNRILIFIFIIHSGITSAQQWQWGSRFGGVVQGPTGDVPDETILDMVTDSEGNVYFCGRIRLAANANGVPLTTYGNYDILVGKLDCRGNLVWVKTAGSGSDDQANSITQDEAGNIYIIGDMFATTSNPCNLFGSLITETTTDFFITKFDTSGQVIWSKIAGPGNIQVISYGYTIDYIPNGTICIGFKAATNRLLFPNDSISPGMWLATMDTSGVILNKLCFSTDYQAFPKFDYAQGPLGDHYFVTDFSSFDSIVVGGQTVYHQGPTNNPSNLLVFKFDNNGNLQWHNEYGNPSVHASARGEKIMVTSTDDVFICGQMFHGVVIGNDTLVNVFATNKQFPFLAKYNSQGQAQWAINLSSPSNVSAEGGIAELPNGNVVFCGQFGNTGQIDTFNLTAVGGEIFFAEVNQSGNVIGVNQLACSGGTDNSQCFISDSMGNLYIGGGFGGTYTTNAGSYTSAGGYTDGFIAKYGYVCTVGLEEVQAQINQTINVYPNPVKEHFFINVNNQRYEQFSIINMMGAVVMTSQIDNHQGESIRIDSGMLPPGMYIIQLSGQNGVASGKFMNVE